MNDVNSGKLNSYFGEGTILKGTLKFKGLLRFDGEFDGNIESVGILIVGASGKMKANIKTGELYNFGGIEGNVDALNKISLHTSSSLQGDIRAPFLATEEGAFFHGTCAMPVDKRKSVQATTSKPLPASKSYIPSPSIDEKILVSSSRTPVKTFAGAGVAIASSVVAVVLLLGWLMFKGDSADNAVSADAALVEAQQQTGKMETSKASSKNKAAAVKKKPQQKAKQAINDDANPQARTQPVSNPVDESIKLARKSLGKGQYRKALKNLEKTIKAHPKETRLKIVMAETYQLVGLESSAETYFEDISATDPGSAIALNNKGFQALSNGALDDAEKFFHRALQSDKDNLRARLGLALIFVRQGNHESAAKECGKILKVKNDYAPAMNRLAWVYAKQGKKLNEARSLSEKSFYFSQDIPEYIDTLSEVHFRMGDYDKAISLIRRAIALVPADNYYKRQLFKFERAKKHTG